jgi:hypothetical protein
MKKYIVELRYDKNIATDQYKVDLCDNIYISEIASMMDILEYSKYSNNLHHNLGEARNKNRFLRGFQNLSPNLEME